MTQALESPRAEMRALSAHLLTVQEEERRRIAREIHDDLAQRTAMVAFELDQAARFVYGADATAALSAARARLAELETGLRDLSHQLHPSIVTDLGLPAAIKQLVNEFNGTGGSATFDNRSTAATVDPLAGTALYRISQEALRNVRKHAGAVKVSVTLAAKSGEIRLSIQDSGPGFIAEASDRPRGLGLLSMRERARLIGGTLMVRSSPGEGTLVVVRAPLSCIAGTSAKTLPRRRTKCKPPLMPAMEAALTAKQRA
jgi:signal transduction histidine kinase